MFRERYPKIRQQFVHHHVVTGGGEKPPVLQFNEGLGAIQYLTEDEKQLVQFRPNGFSFNRLAPYTTLDDYLPETAAAWTTFLELAAPVQIRKVGLRMINRILLPMEDGRVNFGDYLETPPRLPATGLKLGVIGFLDQQVAFDEETGNQVNIVKTSEVPGRRQATGHSGHRRLLSMSDSTSGMGGAARANPIVKKLEKPRFPTHIDPAMLEPVLSLGLMMAGYTAVAALSRRSSAVSNEAATVRRNASCVLKREESSVALFGPKAGAFSELAALASECSEDDWDGYGAIAVNPQALQLAHDIIRSLPDDVTMPTFSIEPDGCVSLDWMPSRTRTFTLSAGKSDRLPYAWIDGTDRGHAVARWVNGYLPPRILQEINRICTHDSTLRVA